VDNGRRPRSRARAEIGELTDALRATESAIAASGPGFVALTRPRAVDLDTLRRDVLDEDTVLLEYAVGNDRTWLFALTPTTLDVFDLPGRKILNPVVRAAIDAVTARQRDGASQDAAHDAALRTAFGELSAQLLGPIADRLRGPWQGKRLVVVPSGALEYVPFAAPAARGTDGAPPVPLVAVHEVVAAPRRGGRGCGADRRPRRELAIVADPVFEADDPASRGHGRRGRRHPGRRSWPRPLRRRARPRAGRVVASRGATREPLGRLLFSRREATR
jgi:hypothetical protein